MHGKQPVLGFRVSRFAGATGRSLAYCTDVSTIPPETYPLLQNLDVLVLDGLRYRPHPTHLSIDEALAIIDKLKPGRTYLTVAYDILHADLECACPMGSTYRMTAWQVSNVALYCRKIDIGGEGSEESKRRGVWGDSNLPPR